MQTAFSILRTSRELVFKAINNLSLTEIHSIPNGFKNNIAWNVAHIVVTQQLLHYQLTELNLLIPDHLIKHFKKGTLATKKFTQKEWDEIKDLLLGLPDILEEDYKAGLFKNFTEYPTSTGFVLKDINDAITFNSYHEGIHLGIILSQKKLVS